MSTINAYINFNGRCREAMTFYKDCFGGELTLLEVAGSPMEAHHQGPKDQIYHSALGSGPIILMGADMTGPSGYTKGNDIGMAIGCSSAEDAQKFYDHLSQDAKINMPLQKTFWAELFGDFIDKFGIHWMINYDLPKAG